MNATQYTLLAYAIGLLALWGYAALMWIENAALRRAHDRFKRPPGRR